MREPLFPFSGNKVAGVPVFQKEGFSLMTYRMRGADVRVSSDGTVELTQAKGGPDEVIWNSRDGITPFCISSRDGQEMNHVDMQKDIFAPFHEPYIGQRVFIDQTLDMAIHDRRENVERWCPADQRHGLVAQYGSEEQAFVDLGWSDWMTFWPHTPAIVTVDEDLMAFFSRRARELKDKEGM